MALPDRVKPKYALLRPKRETGYNPVMNFGYGQDMFIIDIDAVIDRITITPGDSYVNSHEFEKSWIEIFEEKKIEVSLGRDYYHALEILHPREFVTEPTRIEHAFLPWSHSALVAPWVIGGVRENNLFGAESSFQRPVIEGKDARALEDFDSSLAPNSSFVEVQIWGPLDFSIIKAFEFTTYPPEGKFLKLLLENNIKIYDAREAYEGYETDQRTELWEPELWQPGDD